MSGSVVDFFLKQLALFGSKPLKNGNIGEVPRAGENGGINHAVLRTRYSSTYTKRKLELP